jgi:hypothetical protein
MKEGIGIILRGIPRPEILNQVQDDEVMVDRISIGHGKNESSYDRNLFG